VEDALPASSYAVVRFGGLEQAAEVGGRLGLVRLGQALIDQGAGPAFQQFIGPAIEEAASELRNGLAPLGIAAGDLRGLLARPMALGIGRPTLFGNELIPSVALVVDIGDRAEEIRRVVGALEAILVQTGPDITVAGLTVDGHRARVLSAAEAPGNIVIGRIGDYLLVTNSRGYFRDCVRTIDGKTPRLTALDAVRANLPEPAMLSAYVNTDPVLSVLDPFLPYEASDIGEAIGIRGLTGLYIGVSGAGGGSAEVLHLGIAGSEQGLLRAPFAGPVSLEAAGYCSKDTVLFGAAALDPSAFLDAGQRMLALLPPNARQEVERELSQELGRELRQFGMTPEQLEAIVRAFGPSLSIAVNVPKQLIPIPEVMAFLEIRNPQLVEPILAMVMDQSELEWRTTTSRDREIHYANVKVDNVMLSPCFAFDDGMLLVSSHVRNLKAALGRRERPEDSLAAQPSFRRLQEDVGDATALVHIRGNKLIDLTWPMAESQLRMVLDGPGRQLGLNSDVIPQVEDVSQALGTSSLSFHVNDGGIFLKQVSNTGLGAILAGAAMFFDAVLAQAQGKIY
jgi:hypothetical protein